MDLLDCVLGKLISIADYIRFGAVCKQWQSVASHQKEHRKKSCHKQLPMLMQITNNSSQVENEAAALFSVARVGQLRQLNFLPHYIKNKQMKFCGSTHGWLVYQQGFVLTLLNPFTGHTITLPPIPTYVHGTCVFINPVALSADLCLCPDDYEILVQYYYTWYDDHHFLQFENSLAYFKAVNGAWSQIGDDNFAGTVRDAVYYKGKFVALTDSELPATRFTTNFCSIPTTNSFELPLDRSSVSMTWQHILESTGGDLLLVQRFEDADSPRKIGCIQVFKLLHEDGNVPRWLAIKSIGSDVLFLGGHREAMCVSALDFPECVPNSIYFTDGVFNLDKTDEGIVKHNWLRASEEEMYSKTLLWVSLPTIV